MSANANARLSPRARYADNIYFRDGTPTTAILVLLLYLLLGVSLDAAGYVNNLTVLVPVILGAFSVGFFMSMSRFDGFFALSHSMFVGLAWILFLMSRSVTRVEIASLLGNGIPEAQAQAYFLMLQWFGWLDAAWNREASANNYIFVFEMAFLVWWLTYLGVWSIFRYGYTWRAIIPAGIVLLINAYYAPDGILGFLVIFFLLALLLLIRTNLSEQQLRWREQRVIFSQDIALDFFRNGVYYSIVVLALALILPGLGRNPQVRGALAPVNQQWEVAQERVNQLYQGLNRQAGTPISSFGNTLTLGGEREVSSETVFRVRTPVGRYWRAIVYDSFNGRSWVRTDTEKVAYSAGEVIPLANWAMREPLTQTITMEAPIGYVLFAAPDILQVNTPLDATVRVFPSMSENAGDENAPAEPPGPVEVTVAQARQSFGEDETYTVVSMNTAVTQQALRAASTDYPQAILDTYLQLPEDFSQRVAQDAITITADAETIYDKARALEIHLRGYEYNDAIEAPPADRDPIEYFLYDIREGYCDYYATSMVLMLRSLGIPARAVSGYAEGFYNEEIAEYIITQRDAHTWVEVFFPEYGWIEFEPTAGESQLNRPQALDDADNPFDDSASAADSSDANDMLDGENDLSQFDDPNAFGEEFNMGEGGATMRGRFWWLWGIVTPFILIAGLVALWRFKFVGPTQFDPDATPILYERLQGWMTRLGLRRRESQTPYETAGELSRAVPDGKPPIDLITDRYVEYAFSGRQSNDASAETLDAWSRLRPVLWRAWFDRLTRRFRPRPNKAFDLIDE